MDLKQTLQEAGIVGAGGAGFPAYAKLAEGADTLLINGAECEPLLYSDYFLLRKEMPQVLFGAQAVAQYLNVKRIFLCIKGHTARRLGLAEGETLAYGVAVKVLPDVYPMGDEVSLIYQATGRVVRAGNLPITAGVIVNNAETLYNVAGAVQSSQKVVEKWVTVGGNVKQSVVVKVPVGTPVSALFQKLSLTIPEEHVVVDGGPSMGKIIDYENAVVTKTTKGLLVLPERCEAVRAKRINAEKSVARAETACCQCTRCTDLCPRALLGYPLEPHKLVRTSRQAATLSPGLVLSATLCCGCGLCTSLACCQGISPKAVIDGYKALLAQNKMRFVAKWDTPVPAEREYRMIPSERWASMLGVAAFDCLPDYRGEMNDFDRVEIALRSHIGAPSVPCVQTGDRVAVGDRIAESGQGLSLPQHASLEGVVEVRGDRIIIYRK